MSIHELQAALRALDEVTVADCTAADWFSRIDDARYAVIAAARRVAEGAGEPEQWQWFDDGEGEWQPVLTEGEAEQRRIDGQRVRPLYTTPPSADASELLDALMQWANAERCLDVVELENARRARNAALAKHKENTDGR